MLSKTLKLIVCKFHLESLIIAFTWIICFSSPTKAQQIGNDENTSERPSWIGFYTIRPDAGINSLQFPFIKGIADRLKWSDMEPNDSVFTFTKLDTDLNNAIKGGFYYYFVLWSGPDAPQWIYTKDIPKVFTTTSGSGYYPYYLAPNYSIYFHRFIDKLAEHIASLSETQRNAIAFIQPAFGSTGDQQLYKGTPLDNNYNITDQQYFEFCSKAAARFYEAFNKPELKKIKFLFNIEEETDTTLPGQLTGPQLFANWLRQNYTIDLRKQQFTVAVGYQTNNEIIQDDELRPSFFGLNGKAPDIVRGEFSGPFANALIFKENLIWNYYWTAISTVDRGLDMWEVGFDAVKTGLFNEAFSFANKYAYYKRPQTSPYAFIALRDVLDASDISRFPVDKYGTVAQNNADRFRKIEADFSKYGAKIGDITAATSLVNADYLKNATALNDVGYKLIARNYSRFITQIDANNTSVGLWRVGPVDQPYGRYARAFENSTAKNRMYFDLNDDLFPVTPIVKSVEIKIIYLDEGTGKFSFRYDASTDHDKQATVITKTNSKKWVEKIIKIEDGAFSNLGPKNSDFSLVNEDTEDDIFHMIEIAKSSVYLSVQEHKKKHEVIYPNPAHSKVNLDITSPIDEITVYNLCGTVQMKMVKPSGNSIDLSQLHNGIYLFKISFDNQVVVQKVIKD